jgi:hypothetical protein
VTLFTAHDYAALHRIVFSSTTPYPGYRPEVIEAPAGDAARQDVGKRYAHVATKYLRQYDSHPGQHVVLTAALDRAHGHAVQVALRLGVPEAFLPSYEHGALRVLEYPPGTGASHVHTDSDLFTLNCYRNVPNEGLGQHMPVHMGRLGEQLGLGFAFAHHVNPMTEAQHSIVYFAIPDHAAVLPNGETVGEWIIRELAKMRYDRPEVKA